MSQRQVAQVLGENQSWVSKIEKGERRADLAEGTRMMRLYRVEPNAILMPEGLPKALEGLALVADALDAQRGRRRSGKVFRPKYSVPRGRSARTAKARTAKARTAKARTAKVSPASSARRKTRGRKR